MLLNPSADRRVRVLSLGAAGARGFIAEECALHLTEMTGARHDRPQPIAKLAAALSPALVLSIESGIGREAYACAVQDGFVHVRGGDERGLYYGVLAFFEALGFRWFAPGTDGAVIPRRNKVEVPDNWRAHGAPAFPWRGYHICGTGKRRDGSPIAHFDHETALWMARNRMNFKPIHNEQYDEAAPLLEEMLLSPLAFGHSYSGWVRGQEFEEHPEFFPLIAGVRQKEGQRCVSNRELQKLVSERIVAYADAHPALPIISLAPNDGYKWCQCPDCSAMDSAQDQAREELNRRHHLFSAGIARRVAALRPGCRISTIAYSNYLDPAEDVPREDALVISMCITRAQNRALDDPQSPSSSVLLDRTDRWLAKAGGVFWSCYFLSYGGTFPRPYEEQTVRTLRLLARKGVTGIKSEVVPGEYGLWRSAIFFLYLVARAAYDTSLDWEAVLADFCEQFYGPAAAPMEEHYRLHSAVVRRYAGELTQMDADAVSALYSDEDVIGLRRTLAAAERALHGADPVYARRLAIVQRQTCEIEDTRREMRLCVLESAPLHARHRARPPGFEDFDALEWTPQRMRQNRLLYPHAGRFSLAWSDEALYVCFRLDEPDMRLVVEGNSRVPDAGVWGRSNVDCFFCPMPESGVYYQVAVNLLGKCYTARNRGREWDSSFDLAPDVRVKHRVNGWDMILGLRFDRLQMTCPTPGAKMRLALNRGQLCGGPCVLGGWPNGGSWHNIRTMGEVLFTKEN